MNFERNDFLCEITASVAEKYVATVSTNDAMHNNALLYRIVIDFL